MSLLSDYQLKYSLNFQKRVAAALVIAAEAIRNESEVTSNHVNRLNWSKNLLASQSGPESEAKRWLWMILQNATIKSLGNDSADGDIQFAVNSLIDYFSTPATETESFPTRILLSNLTHNSEILLISDTAYFVFLGTTSFSFTPKYVEFYVTTAAVGTQTAEVGLFSSSNMPNKANQSMVKITSTGTIDSLLSTGIKRNTAAFITKIAIGTNLWAGIRTAMETTQPTISGLSLDMAQGQILSTASAGVLTDAGPWTGSIIAATTSACCPNLRITLD